MLATNSLEILTLNSTQLQVYFVQKYAVWEMCVMCCDAYGMSIRKCIEEEVEEEEK